MKAPDGLRAGGRALWDEIAAQPLTQAQAAMLTEACRARDRLDKLDGLLRGDVDHWAEIRENYDGSQVYLNIDQALTKANATAAVMRQMLTDLPAAKPAAKPKGSALDEIAKRRAARQPATGKARTSRAR